MRRTCSQHLRMRRASWGGVSSSTRGRSALIATFTTICMCRHEMVSIRDCCHVLYMLTGLRTARAAAHFWQGVGPVSISRPGRLCTARHRSTGLAAEYESD